MSEHTVEYIVRVHEEDDGYLWAEVLDLPGCFASGATLDELRDAVQEAISLYVADGSDAGTSARMREMSVDAPIKPMHVGEMRVTVSA